MRDSCFVDKETRSIGKK